jgi:uncharacterized membrane protein YeaQ/YmgE (transglycosylase-associated protein family)
VGIIAWIAVGLTAGLLANMLLPGKRSRGLIFICLTCFTGVLGGSWAASQFRLDAFFSFSAWLAAIAEAAVLLLACYLLTGPSGRPGGFTARRDTQEPLGLQLRNLQSLVEIGVDKEHHRGLPAPLMSNIAELGSFLAREQAASPPPLTIARPIPPPAAAANGTAVS